ncbi:unnamed protein product [Spirodela intermedia]|uniref:Uncharacterized protein n=1 Tax=Spirodela intermedia TaxID=51605 RepID=A0A7I8ILC0_SPIIN|nr:unnamed protein product [Spirodela intermedia]CAA6657962.1 unnamed protein product [Spirodela intermedia]
MSESLAWIFSLFRGRLKTPAIATDADRANVAEDGAPLREAQELANEIRGEKQTAMALFGLSAVLLATIITASLNHPSHQTILRRCLVLLFSVVSTSACSHTCWRPAPRSRRASPGGPVTSTAAASLPSPSACRCGS